MTPSWPTVVDGLSLEQFNEVRDALLSVVGPRDFQEHEAYASIESARAAGDFTLVRAFRRALVERGWPLSTIGCHFGPILPPSSRIPAINTFELGDNPGAYAEEVA